MEVQRIFERFSSGGKRACVVFLLCVTRYLLWLVGLASAAYGQSHIAHPRIPYPNPFKHVVLIIQENRTPDNLFQTLLTYPGINAANYDLASSGLAKVNGQDKVVQLTPKSLATDYDPGHSHGDFETMWDNGAMDGANSIQDNCNPNATDCQNNGAGQFLSYKYVQASDIGSLPANGSSIWLGQLHVPDQSGRTGERVCVYFLLPIAAPDPWTCFPTRNRDRQPQSHSAHCAPRCFFPISETSRGLFS